MGANAEQESASPPSFDFDRVSMLIVELEREIAKAPADAPGLQDLRDEMETLKNVLRSPKAKHHWVGDGLRSIRDAVRAVKSEIMTDSPTIAEIGRILGM